jgi:hypothetical protein
VKELCCRNALWRNYTAERFVKKSNWIFRNLQKMYNINFLSNIFQSGDVINVTLCFLLIKTKQI